MLEVDQRIDFLAPPSPREGLSRPVPSSTVKSKCVNSKEKTTAQIICNRFHTAKKASHCFAGNNCHTTLSQPAVLLYIDSVHCIDFLAHTLTSSDLRIMQQKLSAPLNMPCIE